ncbi:MAG TPA: glycosyltransferase family 39 protein [Candidatus Kapabacteria bacterium]
MNQKKIAPLHLQQRRTLIWTMLALNAAILAVVFLIPFNSDLDLYHSMGLELSRGRLPYIGSWDNNFPGIVYFHSLSILIFGKGYLGFRLIDFLIHLGTVLLLFHLSIRYMSALFAAIGATINSLYYVGGSFWLVGQKDGFATFFILLSVLLLLQAIENRSRILNLLFSGVAMGFAIAFRPTYALIGISFLIVLLYCRFSTKEIFTCLLGSVIPWIFILTPYLFVDRGLYQFYESTIALNLKVYAPFRAQYDYTQLFFHPIVILAYASFLRSKNSKGLKIPRYVLLLTVLLLGSVIAGIVTMGKFLVYHFDPLFAIVSVIAAKGIENVALRIPSQWIRYAGVTIVFLLIGRIFYPFNILHHFRDAIEGGNPSPIHAVWTILKADSSFGLNSEEAVTQYVDSTTVPTDCIEVASVMSALRWRIDREECSRFTTVYAYGMQSAGQPYIPFERECQQEMIDRIRSKRPRLLLLATKPEASAWLNMRSPETCFLSIRSMKKFVDSNYFITAEIGPYRIYRLK